MVKSTLSYGKNQSLFHCFLTIQDPRVGGRSRYPLINIIVIVLCGLICGYDTWKGLALFSEHRKRWLSQFIDVSAGMPSHYTIARVFSLIEPKELEKCLQSWIEQACELFAFDVISIDGKTIRGSRHQRGEKKASHIINAYSAKHEATLGCVPTPDKSNEIKGIPILLKALRVKDKIITIDAMGTQKGIANLIRLKQGNYVLALKKNHKRFYRQVERSFQKADELNYEAMVVKQKVENGYAHSRIEKREYTLLPVMYLYKYKKIWRDLQGIIRVKTNRVLANGEIEMASRYYITSLPFKNFDHACFAIRDHWQIENGLHYKLDVGLHEDACPIYRGYADKNLSVMRKIVLKLLNDDTSSQSGVALKRAKASLSTKYLRKVVGF